MPFDPARAARVKEALAERGFASDEPLLDAVFGNSAFLGRLALRETGALGEYFAAGPQTVLNAAILLAHAGGRADSEAAGDGAICASPSGAPRWPSPWPISPALWDVEQGDGAN